MRLSNELHPPRTARILDVSFTNIESAPSGSAAGLSSEFRLPPVVADREGEMRMRVWCNRPVAFLRRHPAVHGALWGALIATLLVLLAVPLRKRLDDPMRRLRLTHRSFEARVVGLPYAPLRATRSAAPNDPDVSLAQAISDLEKELRKERSPENLQRLAIAYLAAGKGSAARRHLEEANAALPDDASILATLASAELAENRVADAAEHSGRALELDPMHAEAAFTWAMAMERFSNRPAAIDAWQRYLIIDSESEWAGEARTRLAALHARRPTWPEEKLQLVPGASAETIRTLVARYPHHTRVRILNILLPQWSASGAPEMLALMRAMATERADDDPFLLDGIEHAARNRQAIAPAVAAWESARQALNAYEYERSAALYAESAKQFEAAGSPFAIAAAINAAAQEHTAGRNDAALARLERIDASLQRSGGRYPSMQAEALWMRGKLLASGSALALGVATWRDAAAAAQRSGEIENVCAIQQLIASALEVIGDPREAEQARLNVLAANDALAVDADRRAIGYMDAAYGALRNGRPRVAIAFTRAQMIAAGAMHDEASQALSDARRALALLDLGRFEAALHSVGSARHHAMQIPSDGNRDSVLSEVDYIDGIVAYRQSRTSDAIFRLSAAISSWQRSGWHLHTASGYLARAEALRAAKDLRGAEQDYLAGIAEMESQRGGFEPDVRVSYFERAENLFERLIGLLVEQGRGVDALSIAERKRARVLLDQVSTGEAATPLDAREIRVRVPAGTALLEITLLPGSAELWLVRDGRIQHARSNVSRKEIEASVTRQLAAIATNDEVAAKREGRFLYDRLLASLTAALPPDSTLLIVPDGALHAVPFAALVTPDDRYLVERFAIASAPSASVVLRPLPSSRRDSLFAVAQPAPRDLQRLSAAADEAEEAAREHRNGRFAKGAAITPDAFLERAGESAWVYFTGHAKTDVEHASRSALMFESWSGPARELTAAEIGASRLPSAPFVVLAACSTGRGTLRRNEGIQSLSAAFLQAGARGVVATLWDVDDVRAAKLFRFFHRNLREGARPADALRSAQRSLLHGSDAKDRAPSVWASAVVEGTI